MHSSPSDGRTRPGKRASNLAVLTRSRILRQTMRPSLPSRARQTFDMLPCPIRPKSSKRFLISMMGTLLFFFGPNKPDKNPTVVTPRVVGRIGNPSHGSVFAIVDQPCHFGPQ